MRVLARAYGSRPLDRVVTGETEKLTYLVNASAIDANGIAPFSGVGFPRDAVYKFDSALFEALEDAWSRDDLCQLEMLWQKAGARENVEA